MYNYRVAAYLKTSNNLKVFDCSLETIGFDVMPPPILKENSFLNVESLLDIVISGPDREYLCECKHHQPPKQLTIKSTDVKDAILEFIASERYRLNSFKRNTIFYLFITNCSVEQLNQEISALQIGDDKTVSDYCLKLKKRAPKKWPSYDTNRDIKLEWVRSVVARIRLIQIDDGRLQEAKKDANFEKELKKIMQRVYEENPLLVPIEYKIENTIRIETANDTERPLLIRRRGFNIELSMLVVNQLLSQCPPSTIKKASCVELPFVRDCEIRHPVDVSVEKATEIITEALNDILRERHKTDLIVAITPGTYEVYLVNVKWLQKSLVFNSRGLCDAAKTANKLPFKLSKFLLANLIQESKRPNAVVRKDVIDFTEYGD